MHEIVDAKNGIIPEDSVELANDAQQLTQLSEDKPHNENLYLDLTQVNTNKNSKLNILESGLSFKAFDSE